MTWDTFANSQTKPFTLLDMEKQKKETWWEDPDANPKDNLTSDVCAFC